MNGSKKIPLLALCIASISTQALAVNSSTFQNDTHETVAVAWTAAGCAGIQCGHSFVCQVAFVPPETKAAYQYHWGATNDNIHIGYYDPESKACFVAPGGDDNGCVLKSPDKKTVVLTSIQDDIVNKPETWQCKTTIK